ncbi:hypothetical protein KIH74_12560 [Kineosporia sp. J2-2]|uniref:Uncharacterized protein n=1 Tax=Kineosporia corallincola TaxID=2835133 RepID=A0ABS5TF95_9ACTN|nr:hypothetical protein [Kineosporia corallincola]MBT0769760.1 hypothetical protein [Kineosporia corallincola]
MTAQIGQLVRDLLTGDLNSYPEQTKALDEPGWNAFGEIVGAAFYTAVGRRLAGQQADVAAFVSAAAAPYAQSPVAIDESAAQALVRSVLGDDATVGQVLEQLDEPDLARIELVLLRRLIEDGNGDITVDALVSSAQDEAAEFSGEAGVS